MLQFSLFWLKKVGQNCNIVTTSKEPHLWLCNYHVSGVTLSLPGIDLLQLHDAPPPLRSATVITENKASKHQSCAMLATWVVSMTHVITHPNTQRGFDQWRLPYVQTLNFPPRNVCSNLCSCCLNNWPVWQPRGWLKRWAKCASLCILFKKTFGPITFERIIELQPNCYHGLPSSAACFLQNDDSQIPILSAQRPCMCAWVRLSFPYYRVRIQL